MANRQTIVGGFVLGSIVLALVALVLFSRQRPFEPVIRAVAVFDGSVNGLIVGAPVTFRGVRVGSVRRITLQFDPSAHKAYIPVLLQLEPDRVTIGLHGTSVRTVGLEALVHDGLRAQLNVQSFVTGQAEVDLDFRPDTPATLYRRIPGLPEIPTLTSQLQQIKDQLANLPLLDLARDAEHTLQSVQALTEHMNRALPPLISSLTETSDNSSEALQTASGAIHELQGKTGHTLDAIGQLSVDGDQQLRGRGAELRQLLVNSNQAMDQAQLVLKQVGSLTAPRSRSRDNIESSLADLSAAAASLRGLASDLERDPQMLLTGRGR